jgi:cytochrome c556
VAACAVAVSLGVVFLSGGQAADEKDLRAAMNKLVKTAAEKPDDLPKAAADLATAHKIDNESVKQVMDLLGRRDGDPPGWGVGPAGTIKPDGIEPKLRDLIKQKSISKAQLEKEGDALLELANRTAAVAAVGQVAAPKKDLPGKTIKDWKEYSEDMGKFSRDLAKAVKARNPEAVKDAAGKLNGSCSSCHSKFRD